MQKIPYSSIIGSLMYAMVCTRLEISNVVGVVSCFLANPGKENWQVVKWILRYLKGTSKVCLSFKSGKFVLNGYTNADMAGDVDSRKSTSNYMMTLARGGVMAIQTTKMCCHLSSTEAEYIVVKEDDKELLWMHKFLQDLVLSQEKYVLYCDS